MVGEFFFAFHGMPPLGDLTYHFLVAGMHSHSAVNSSSNSPRPHIWATNIGPMSPAMLSLSMVASPRSPLPFCPLESL
jgi:hypothetical protein